MLDTKALQLLVEQQVKQEVTDRVSKALNAEWLKTVEDNAVKFMQDRVVSKFANSEAMPELIDAVKQSVKELFKNGHIPGISDYVDHQAIKDGVNNSTQELVNTAIQELSVDKNWLKEVEAQVNRAMTQRVAAALNVSDVRDIVNRRVAEITKLIIKELLPGIQDQSEKVELTLLDGNVVVENTLTAKDIQAVESLTVKNLVVKSTINTDNKSWQQLADDISQQTLDKLAGAWKDLLVKQVAETIRKQGIEFDSVTVKGQKIIDGDQLSNQITKSNLQQVGKLNDLVVTGSAHLANTVTVINKRLGINTTDPDSALSIWDEEVNISVGKYKDNTAYFGTSRDQALTIGVNKKPMIEINNNGLTAIKQLQVGIHKISHGNEVPNYSGTKGDVVFNANPTIENPVFAWQCLGGFRWKVIKAVE